MTRAVGEGGRRHLGQRALLDVAARSELRATFEPLTALFLIFARTTALFLSWVGPTLLAGSEAAAYAPPLRATNSASVDVTFA